MDLGDGVQKFSMHWEADLDRGGASVLDIRPLLWKDGWPVAGENMKEGTYEIESARTGTALELAVEGVPVGGRRGGRGGGFGGPGAPGAARGGTGGPAAPNAPAQDGTNAPAGRGPRGGGLFGGTGSPVPPQDVAQVSTNWPTGEIGARLANYQVQAQQKWTVTPVANAGGYPGSPYFKITVAGTDRALAATANGELVSLPSFTGAPEQLWRLDQLTDGSWRVMPKSAGDAKEPLALSAIGARSVTLSKFDPVSAKHRWNFKAP
jgi:arabinan endo-1,5-alpha-L-arabinosidase